MRDGWVETNLLDVVEVLDRFRKPINATERESRQGSIPYYGANGQTGWIDDFLFNEELVLLGEDAIDFADPSARKAYLIDGPSWVNNHAHVLRAKIDKVESYFLAESQNKVDFSQYVSFGTRSKLTQASMNRITIPLPPLPVQKRIVDLISSVDSYIKALQHQLKSAKRSRNAVLHELLTAGGDDRVQTKLGLIAEFVMGQAPLGKRCNKEGIGTPFVKAGEFGENRPEIVEWTTDPLKMAKHSDVLVCVVGATAGKINLGVDCAIGRSVAAIRPSKNLNQFYLYYLLSLELSNLRSGSRGSAQGVITKDDLYRIPVRLPSSEEQDLTVSIVSSIDNFKDNITSTLGHIGNLRSGLLSDLLSGEHEIPSSYDKVMGVA